MYCRQDPQLNGFDLRVSAEAELEQCARETHIIEGTYGRDSEGTPRAQVVHIQ